MTCLATPIQYVPCGTTASGTNVTGTYEWPAGTTNPHKGKITSATITQVTTTVTGDVSLSATATPNVVSASPVSGVQIEFNRERGTATGKGLWNSVKEQTLLGTWGFGASTNNGGVLHLKKVP